MQGNGSGAFDAGQYSFFGNLETVDDGLDDGLGLEGALEVWRTIR